MPGKTSHERRTLDALSGLLTGRFEEAGFDFISPDILQPADVFLDRSGEDIRSRTFVFTDPYGFTQHPNTPLIEPNTWESTWAAVPHVVQDGERWLMFYSGGVGGQSSELGLAQSPDGLVWEKNPDEPLLQGGGMGVAWNYAQNTGDQWELWYTMGFGGGGYPHISHATAPAPEGPWETDNLRIRAPGDDWNDEILPTGFVEIDGTYFIPYAAFPDRGSRPSIGLFTSTDNF